jgi:hypothetical protein
MQYSIFSPLYAMFGPRNIWKKNENACKIEINVALTEIKQIRSIGQWRILRKKQNLGIRTKTIF